MTIELYGKEYKVKIKKGHYVNNDNFALYLECENGEPFGSITVNLDEKVSDYYGYVDTNNNPEIERFIAAYNLGYPVGRCRVSGYCTYPLYHFNKEMIERLTEE